MDSRKPPEAARAVSGFNSRVERAMARVTWATLGTEDPDGSVQMVPVSFLFEDGKIFVPTNGRTRKASNLRDRPRATVLVETKGRAGWVAAKGTVELVDGDAAHSLILRINSKYLTEEGLAMSEATSLDDTTIVVTPTSWRSWSPKKMFEVAQAAGYAPEAIAKAYKPRDL